MTVSKLLERLGATDEVVAHVRDLEGGDGAYADLGRLWKDCTRGDAAVWLAARRGTSVPEIVAAVSARARAVAAAHAEASPILEALDAADACLAGEDGAAARCIEAADACLALSESADDAASYRGSTDEAMRSSARAAEWVARAAEGLATAAARYWALRAETARATGALIGLPSFAVLGAASPDALKLGKDGESEATEHDELAFVLAASAESVRHSARALAAPAEDAASIASAHATCAALLREGLPAPG